MAMETSLNKTASLMEMETSPSMHVKCMTDAYPFELDMSEEDEDMVTK